MWDKKGENLTYRFLRLLTEQSAGKRALIIGDSQGGSNATGGALASILSGAGYNVVNKSKYGSYTAQAANQIPDTNFDLVVLFTGGHFKSKPGDALKIAKMFPSTTKFIISGPPPVQRIKDISGSVRKFPYLKNISKDQLETYFVNPQDQRAKSMYQGRERRNSAFKQAAASAGVSYIDPRSVFGATNPADFPVVSNSDGIHMYGDVASQMATAIAGVIDQQLKAAPARAEKAPKATKVIRAAKEKAPRCLRSNILAIGAGMGKHRDMKNRVIALQQAIVDKKLTKNPKNFVDGKFGEKTLMAVIGAQILNDLKPDGCAGPQTLAALGVKDAPTKTKTVMPREVSGVSRRHGRVPEGKLPEIVAAIRAAAEKHGVPEDVLMGAVQIESGFNPNARSYANARGLFQFMPNTGKAYGLQTDEDFYDIQKNADAGARLFIKNLRAAEKIAGPLTDETQYLSYVAHNQGRGGMRQIYRSAKSGGRRQPSKTVQRNMRGQGTGPKRAMADNPDNPAQGFLDYFKNKWNRMKDKGMNIASAVGAPSDKEVA
jgi:peptidoglycan hydrolase-like protein with peptidoglycan-binding domain